MEELLRISPDARACALGELEQGRKEISGELLGGFSREEGWEVVDCYYVKSGIALTAKGKKKTDVKWCEIGQKVRI